MKVVETRQFFQFTTKDRINLGHQILTGNFSINILNELTVYKPRSKYCYTKGPYLDLSKHVFSRAINVCRAVSPLFPRKSYGIIQSFAVN